MWGWIKVCSVYAKYLAGSIAMGRINTGDFTIQSAYTLYRVLKLNPSRVIERPCGAEKVLVEFKVLCGWRPMRVCSLIIEEAK